MKRTFAFFVFGLLFGAVSYSATPLGAHHPGSDYYDTTFAPGALWESSPTVKAVNMQYFFDGNSWRKNRTKNDIQFAMQRVDIAGGSGLAYGFFGGFVGGNLPSAPAPTFDAINLFSCGNSSYNTITIGSIELSNMIPGSDVLAFGGFCQIAGPPTNGGPSPISRGLVAIDIRTSTDGSPSTWHGGWSTPVPANKTDFRSVLVHELIHVTGWVGHFPHAGTECNTTFANRQSMCPVIPPETFYVRTPGVHDTSVIHDAYN